MKWYTNFLKEIRMSQEIRKQFRLELMTINLKIGMLFLYFVAGVQLINIMHTLFFRSKQLAQFPIKIYLGMYILLFLLCCCYLIKVYVFKKNIAKYLLQIEFLSISFLILILFWSTTISLLDLQNTNHIIIHAYCMIAVSVTLYISPKIFIPILMLDYIYLVVCYTFMESGVFYNISNATYATLVLGISIVITCFRYYERIYSFMQKQTIIKQSKVIQDRNAELKKLAVTDTLSGLYNRRLLNDALTDKWEECAEFGVHFSFIMIDIDNFKNVNDTYGHLCGDSCIVKIADIIRECTEDTEAMSFRYGGEEFAILLSHQNKEKVIELAEQIRSLIENAPIICAEEGVVIYITVSIGLCCDIPKKDSNYFEYISMADMALRVAKQNGKNQVQVSEWKHNKNVMYE